MARSPIQMLDSSDSLDTLWEELAYSDARFRSDPDASALAEPFGVLIDRVILTEQGQRTVWRREIEAQAACDADTVLIHALVANIERDLLHAERQGRSAPRYRRYFGRTARDISRLGLASTLEHVQGWPTSLASEPEPALSAHAEPLTALIARGRASLQRRADATSARADHRAREIVALFDDANAARLSALGELLRIAPTRDQAPTWASGFFRRSNSKKRRRAAEAEDNGGTVDPAAPGGPFVTD